MSTDHPFAIVVYLLPIYLQLTACDVILQRGYFHGII